MFIWKYLFRSSFCDGIIIRLEDIKKFRFVYCILSVGNTTIIVTKMNQWLIKNTNYYTLKLKLPFLFAISSLIAVQANCQQKIAFGIKQLIDDKRCSKSIIAVKCNIPSSHPLNHIFLALTHVLTLFWMFVVLWSIINNWNSPRWQIWE